MVNIELYEQEFANSEPIIYTLKKGGNIKITPIQLKKYFNYENIVNIFTMEKNEFGSIEFIQMSYLEFLSCLTFSDNLYSDAVKQAIIDFAKLCLGYDKVAFDKDKNKMCLLLCDEKGTIEKVIKPKEFEDIKKIVLYQNDPSYDDREISQDMKQIMKEYYELKYKDMNIPTLEQKKAFVSSKIGKTFKELGELPIREFELVYQSCVDSEIYIAQKIIQGSYKYDVKEDIPFPLYEKKKDPFEEVLNGKSGLSGISGAEGIGQGIE